MQRLEVSGAVRLIYKSLGVKRLMEFQIAVARLNVFPYQHVLTKTHAPHCGPGSVIGLATGYGLDDPGIKSRWGRDFPHLSRPVLWPTQPPVQCVLGLSRG